ncbi:MAG: AAA family ATPase [Candidatus Contendobacter sp.]|nr:AAA family ATPase [Candidatus Contendobacter sp.]MDG4559578.1 AAA family ATPase [Candidatus Contendobacter sp.]
METIFLIGPSGVGKTKLAQKVLQFSDNVKVVDLDNEIKKAFPTIYFMAYQNWERFWEASIRCIQENQTDNERQFLIVDVGAGSLQSRRAPEFFKNQKTVLVFDTPENTLRKIQTRPDSHWVGRSVADFTAVEYSPNRRMIYAVASHRIDVGTCSLREAAMNLLDFLKKLNG